MIGDRRSSLEIAYRFRGRAVFLHLGVCLRGRGSICQVCNLDVCLRGGGSIW